MTVRRQMFSLCLLSSMWVSKLVAWEAKWKNSKPTSSAKGLTEQFCFIAWQNCQVPDFSRELITAGRGQGARVFWVGDSHHWRASVM